MILLLRIIVSINLFQKRCFDSIYYFLKSCQHYCSSAPFSSIFSTVPILILEHLFQFIGSYLYLVSPFSR